MKEILLNELSEIAGILPGFYDIKGNYHHASIETKSAILEALGYDLSSESSIREAIERKRLYPWLEVIEPVHVVSLAEGFNIFIYIPAESAQEKRTAINITLFDQEKRKIKEREIPLKIYEERLINGTRYIKIKYEENQLDSPGYYDLELEIVHPDISVKNKRSKIILSPERAYLPFELEKARCWGLSLNLYSLRSSQNWGAGDFGDLKRLIPWLSELGASIIAINPLHAIPNTVPYGISPYAPISRLYKNFIYLDLSGLEAEDVNESISKLRETPFIDYEGVASTKLQALKKAFRFFLEKDYKKNTERAEEFRRYMLSESEDLELFATYMALSERFKTTDWQRWPVEYQDPLSFSIKRFITENKEEILFFQYLQWLIDEQHRDIHRECREKGLLIGLGHDLAIGALKEGFDVWANKDLFVLNMALGAPPDDFSPDGQNWGFPPMNPEKLRDGGYNFFIKTLKKNMQYGGALRIDHAFGLFRQFWIPEGRRPSEGAYVRFPHEELLKIICLESVRNNTIIIAEDLGTGPEKARETLQKYGMLSYRLFYFERNYPDPSFPEPSKYPELSLSAITTHDLPTIYGFWKAVDIEQRKKLGKYQDERTYIIQVEERQRDRLLIIEALKREGILKRDYVIPEEMTEELCLAIYNYLARTPSKIVLVSLDDIIGAIAQQNMPGTVDAYPNWRQRSVKTLEEILQDKGFIELALMFEREGRRY